MLILPTKRSDNTLLKEILLKLKSKHYFFINIFRLISVLEQMNSVTLKDLQSEMSCNADLFDLIAFLGETI